jgi:hypothetical protein
MTYYHSNNKHREHRKNIEGSKREKTNNIQGKPIKITADFSTETLKARRAWNEVFWELNENNYNPRIFYTVKLSFKIEGSIKVFHDKQKLKQYMITKPPLKRFFKELYTQEMKAYKGMKGQAVQTTGEEKARKHSVTLIQLHTIKPLNNKDN